MNYNRFADPKIDSTFKLVFGQNKNKDITRDFLNDVLERPEGKKIERINFINRENTPMDLQDKQTFLDIACTDQTGAQFIIEIQRSPQSYFARRAVFYTANLYIRQLSQGESYNILQPVIFLEILTDPFFKNHDQVVTHHRFYDQFKTEQSIDLLELHFVELSKFHKKIDQLVTNLDKWLFYLKDAATLNHIPQAYDDCPTMQKAFEIIERSKWTKEQIDLYERQEMYARALFTTALDHQETKQELEKAKKDLEEAEQAVAQSRLQAQQDVACNLLQEGMSIDFIVKATGLSKAHIEKLCGKK